jgi:hypothetical protein
VRPKNKIPGFSFELPTVRPLELIIHSVNVEVGERPIRATWSPELAQDLAAYHNIDAEQELTDLLSQHVAAEIDREILGNLMNETVEQGYPPRTGFEPIQTLRQHRLIEEEVSSGWNGITPIVRRVFAQTIAQDLVPIQPMGPPPNLFYLDPIFHGNIEEPIVYDDGSYSISHSFNGVIGISTEVRPQSFVKSVLGRSRP